MRHIAANVLTLLVAALIAVIAALQAGKRDFAEPGPAPEETVVAIEAGVTASEAVAALDAAGVLPERTVFGLFDGAALLNMHLRSTGRVVKQGEYAIPARASLEEIEELITTGRSIQYAVTVPEGLTSWEVVELLRATPTLSGEIETVPPEGSLAPETYFVDRGTSRAALIGRMQAAQREILAEAWAGRAEGLPLASPEEALILASIVEKEAALPEERARVASVFVNWLRRGMRLQTDPTVVYGAIGGEGALDRPPTGPEQPRPPPGNTYQIDRLPPTPIANPGRASIEATLDPDDTPYLYFVADGTGGHVFAETLVEHNANVRAWRRIEARRRAAQQSGEAAE